MADETPKPKVLSDAEKFLELFRNGLTKEEFVQNWEMVVKKVIAIREEFNISVESLKIDFATLSQQLKDDHSGDLEEIKTQARLAVGAAINDTTDRIKKLEARLNAFPVINENDLLARLRSEIPALPPEETPQETRDKLESLQENDRLDVSAIRGLEEWWNTLFKKNSKPDNSRHVNAPSRGIFTFISGVKKGLLSNFNFVGGSGIAIAYSLVNGLPTLTFNASGSGISVETPPEAPNGIIDVFSVSAQPQWVVADGTTYYENAGYTYGAHKITMAIPPGSFIRAII